MHTGHKPFRCELCNQHFSEAATLQQHKRRHTHESKGRYLGAWPPVDLIFGHRALCV
jgi:hypothetical protein